MRYTVDEYSFNQPTRKAYQGRLGPTLDRTQPLFSNKLKANNSSTYPRYPQVAYKFLQLLEVEAEHCQVD